MLAHRRPGSVVLVLALAGILAACGSKNRSNPDPDAGDTGDGGDVGTDANVSPDADDIGLDPDAFDVDVDSSDVTPMDVPPDVPDVPGPRCGDGLRDPGEACDDGNTDSGDGCSDDCIVETCGDGAISAGLGEECEDGVALTTTCRDLDLGDGALGCLADTCRFDVRDCDRGRCGDGEVSGDEGCDDGNALDGDGCSSLCFAEACVRGFDADGDGTDDCDDVEVCDGVDNDGDGLVDDHPTDDTLGDACDAGCGSGAIACIAGALVCDGATPVAPAVCNGRDDECTGSPDGCDATIPAGDRLERDVAVRAPELDVLLLVDGSPSMAEARAYLAGRLDDGWWPDGATRLAVATLGDLPVSPIGAPTDRPWTLHRRAATLVPNADRLAAAFEASAASRAGDPGLAAWPALVHAADGAGFTWPGRPRDPAPVPGTLARRDADEAVTFTLAVRTGQRVDLEVVAARVGEAFDGVLTVQASDGTVLARNDDRFATDPAVTLVARQDDTLTLVVSSCCDDGPPWGDTEGWFVLDARLDDAPHVVGGALGACRAVEGATDAPLQPATAVWPRDADACWRDCRALGAPSALVADFCGDGLPIGRCGNGRLDSGETCDDGDFVVGDGCGADCQLESDRVAAFDAIAGVVPALGHGDRGGFGFTDGARPIVVWITDSPAHDTDVWAAIEADLPGAADAAAALRAAGLTPIVVDPSDDAEARDAYAEWAAVAGGTTDVCAWGDDRSCPDDRCCDGTDAGVAPTDGACALAVGGGSASLGAHVEAALGAAVDAPRDLTLVIESDVDGAACLIDAVTLDAAPECGDAPRVSLDAGRITGVRPGQRFTLFVETSNRDTRDTDGDGNLMESCVRAASVPVRLVARDAAGAVYLDEPFTIEVE